MLAAEMKSARGDARNAASEPISSGCPIRPTGVAETTASERWAGIDRTRGVAINPGKIALQVIPAGPNS